MKQVLNQNCDDCGSNRGLYFASMPILSVIGYGSVVGLSQVFPYGEVLKIAIAFGGLATAPV